MLASVLALSISAAVVMFGFGIVLPFLPLYAQILGAGSGLDIGLLSSAFLLTRTFLATPFGMASDRIGRKKMIMLGMAVYAITSILFALSESWFQLLIFRLLQGVASAMVWPPATALVADLTPAGKRGAAMGIYNSISMSGWVIGPAVGGGIQWYARNVMMLEQLESFRLPFYFSAALSLISLSLVWFLVKLPAIQRKGMDPPALFPFKHIEGKFKKTIYSLLVIGISYGFATSFIEPLLVYFVQHEYFLSPDEVTQSMAAIFSVTGIATLLVMVYAGRLADKFSKKKIIAVFTSVAQALTIAMPFSGSISNIGVVMVIRSAFYSLTSPAYTALQQDLLPQKVRGTLTGMFDTFFGLGSIAGPVISFILYDEVSHSMPFIVSGILGIATVLILFLIAKEPAKDEVQ
ncbi:MAG: MFS transporter [Candidatus Methanomethylicia archaeon]|nr:MFS transporter [Candidatus Methanomethylicia archaeon]